MRHTGETGKTNHINPQPADTKSSAPALSQKTYVNPMQSKNIASGQRARSNPNADRAMPDQTSISQAMEQSNPITQPSSSSRALVFVAAAIGGILLIAVILVMAYPGGIGGLLNVIQGGQESLVIVVPEPAIEAQPTPPPPQEVEVPPTPIPAPDVEETPTPLPERDIIQFGNYDWQILEVQGNQALIITDRIIYSRWFHSVSEAVTWETSDIRHWLNNEFINRFSTAEQAQIAETFLVNLDNQWDFSDWNGVAHTPGGNNTTDRLFLLSVDEVLRYFGDSGLVTRGASMSCSERADGAPQWPEWGIYWLGIHDQYNETRVARELEGTANWWWWLRSPGSFHDYAAIVGQDGDISLYGLPVTGFFGGVRPALWLVLD